MSADEIECWLCGESDCELRVLSDGRYVAPEYVCEECFSSEIISFDDLPPLSKATGA
jgi:hypothetical protein